MLFADTKSRDGGIVVVVVVPPLHQNDFRPVKEIDWISECAVQRLPRLCVLKVSRFQAHGFLELPTPSLVGHWGHHSSFRRRPRGFATFCVFDGRWNYCIESV